MSVEDSSRSETEVTVRIGDETRTELRGILDLAGSEFRKLFTSSLDGGKSIMMPKVVDPDGYELISQWINTGMLDASKCGYTKLLSGYVAAMRMNLGELRDICSALVWPQLEWTNIEGAFEVIRSMINTPDLDDKSRKCCDSATGLLWFWMARNKSRIKRKVPKRSRKGKKKMMKDGSSGGGGGSADDEKKDDGPRDTDMSSSSKSGSAPGASDGYSGEVDPSNPDTYRIVYVQAPATTEQIESQVFASMTWQELQHFLTESFSAMKEEDLYRRTRSWLINAIRDRASKATSSSISSSASSSSSSYDAAGATMPPTVAEAWTILKPLFRWGSMSKAFLCKEVYENGGVLTAEELLSIIRAQTLRDESLTDFILETRKQSAKRLGKGGKKNAAVISLKKEWKKRVIAPTSIVGYKFSGGGGAGMMDDDDYFMTVKVDRSTGELLSDQLLSEESYQSLSGGGYDVQNMFTNGPHYWCSNSLGYGAGASPSWFVLRWNVERCDQLSEAVKMQVKFHPSYTPRTMTVSYVSIVDLIEDGFADEDEFMKSGIAASSSSSAASASGMSVSSGRSQVNKDNVKWTEFSNQTGIGAGATIRVSLENLRDSGVLSDGLFLLFYFTQPSNSYVGVERVRVFVDPE